MPSRAISAAPHATDQQQQQQHGLLAKAAELMAAAGTHVPRMSLNWYFWSMFRLNLNSSLIKGILIDELAFERRMRSGSSMLAHLELEKFYWIKRGAASFRVGLARALAHTNIINCLDTTTRSHTHTMELARFSLNYGFLFLFFSQNRSSSLPKYVLLQQHLSFCQQQQQHQAALP